MLRTIRLIGDPACLALNAVEKALESATCRVERLCTKELPAWLDRLELEQATRLPNLIVVSADVAFSHEDALLRALTRIQPWCFLPLVIVSTVDSPARCQAAYQAGASSWVVIPTDEVVAQDVASVFVQYWLRTCMLPVIHPTARL